jgi:pimeloyl-ACP methyl ester carboxylesterase
VRLAYRLWRPGPPRRTIAFVHGLASNLTRWTELVSTTRLRDSWDLLRLDLRGFGRSVCRARVGVDEWCRDLAAILETEGVPRAVLAGHCLGANITLHFAARHPAATDGLVLIEPMFRQALTDARIRLEPLVRAALPIVRAANRLGIHRRRLPPIDLAQLDRDARAVMARQGADAFPEGQYGSPLEDLKFTPTAVYLSGLLAVIGPLPDLRAIEAPALALLSSGGRFGDPAITARLLGMLPHGEIRTLTARHWIPTERPAEMREAIEAWCGL